MEHCVLFHSKNWVKRATPCVTKQALFSIFNPFFQLNKGCLSTTYFSSLSWLQNIPRPKVAWSPVSIFVDELLGRTWGQIGRTFANCCRLLHVYPKYGGPWRSWRRRGLGRGVKAVLWALFLTPGRFKTRETVGVWIMMTDNNEGGNLAT